MSDEKVLTKEIAEQFLADFLADEDSVDLSEFTAIEDDAAEILTKAEELGALYLDGLTSVSDAAAESLSKFQGSLLHLNGLTSLTDNAAESLFGMDEYSCHVHGLICRLLFETKSPLSNNAKKLLGNHCGYWTFNPGFIAICGKCGVSEVFGIENEAYYSEGNRLKENDWLHDDGGETIRCPSCKDDEP